MNESIIYSRYSKAIFSLAMEKGLLEEVRKDFMLIKSEIKKNPGFNNFLANPTIKTSEKILAVEDFFAYKIHNFTITALLFLITKKREQYLIDTIRNFLKKYNDHKGILEAEIVTATKIEQKHKDELVEILKRDPGVNGVEMIPQVNKKLIGGFVLKLDDMQIDASLKTKLNKIRQKFLKTSV